MRACCRKSCNLVDRRGSSRYRDVEGSRSILANGAATYHYTEVSGAKASLNFTGASVTLPVRREQSIMRALATSWSCPILIIERRPADITSRLLALDLRLHHPFPKLHHHPRPAFLPSLFPILLHREQHRRHAHPAV
jgi:hypothetical protein